MTEFRPGDRVLVTADCLPAGGMLGTWSDDADSLMLDAKCESHGSQWLAIPSRTHGEVTMTVHYRLRPPRPPDPEPVHPLRRMLLPLEGGRMSDERRLFGQPGDESMQLDIDTVAERLWEDDDTERVVTIEEWTVTDSRSMLPKADRVLDDLVESCTDEGDEYWYEKLEEAAGLPDVVAAFEQAISLLASKVHYWMADKKVAEHRIKLSAGGWQVVK